MKNKYVKPYYRARGTGRRKRFTWVFLFIVISLLVIAISTGRLGLLADEISSNFSALLTVSDTTESNNDHDSNLVNANEEFIEPVDHSDLSMIAITKPVVEKGSNFAYLQGQIMTDPDASWEMYFEILGPGAPISNVVSGQGPWQGDMMVEQLAPGTYQYHIVVLEHDTGMTHKGEWLEFEVP